MLRLMIIVVVCVSLTEGMQLYGLCPAGKPMVYCRDDPCMTDTCTIYPSAKCRFSNCGECKAEWFLGGEKVDCSSPCPRGVPMVRCFMDPCQNSYCPARPEAECRSNYCGGCNAEWFVGNVKVDCQFQHRFADTGIQR